MSVWNFPYWVAHRGAGKLAPENTLAAFRVGASHGYRAFECDVKLSADGHLFLMHDATLDRTTSGHGESASQSWAALSALDAGTWHSPAYAGEPIAHMDAITRYVRANGFRINWEIKPSPGTEAETGAAVANACAATWGAALSLGYGGDWPLLTSFEVSALEAARQAQPAAVLGLLLKAPNPDWLSICQELNCAAVVMHHPLWNEENLAQARAAGLRTSTYTVNDASDLQRLQALDGGRGLDGIITDRVDLFAPTTGT